MASKDTHRWEKRGGQYVYIAPGEDDPQNLEAQRIEQTPVGGTLEEPKTKAADKA